MAKIVRYPGDLKAFASEALGMERTIFGEETQSDLLADNITTDFLRGWGIVGANENPTKQDFNALGYTLSKLISYLHQMGLAEWDDEQEYPEHGICIASDGHIYRSLSSENIGNNPTTDSVNWKYLLSADDVQYDNSASGLVATDVQGAIDKLADSYASYDNVTGGGTLTDSKRFHITDSMTYTLPDTLGIAVGASVVVTKAVGESPTVDTFGAEQIVTAEGSVASLSLTDDTENVLVWNGVNWELVAGDAAAGFTQTFDSSGYQKLPSGLIIQWGPVIYPDFAGALSIYVTFPITFPGGTLGLFQSVDSSQNALSLMHDNLTPSSVNLRVSEADSSATGGTLRYLVLGY